MNDRKNATKTYETTHVRDLIKGSVLRVSGKRAGQSIRCLNGMVWLTQQGDNRDRLLNDGETYLSNLPRTIIIQALNDARIKVCSGKQIASHGGISKARRQVLSHA